MKKILHIIYGFHNGGVEKVLLHYIDAENYDVTIMYLNPSDDKCIRKFQNIKIVKSPYNLTHKYKFYRYLSTYLRKNHFDVIHTHLNKYNYIPLKCAYKNHIDVRISHCHGIDNVTANIIKKFYRIFYLLYIKEVLLNFLILLYLWILLILHLYTYKEEF